MHFKCFLIALNITTTIMFIKDLYSNDVLPSTKAIAWLMVVTNLFFVLYNLSVVAGMLLSK